MHTGQWYDQQVVHVISFNMVLKLYWKKFLALCIVRRKDNGDKSLPLDDSKPRGVILVPLFEQRLWHTQKSFMGSNPGSDHR